MKVTQEQNINTKTVNATAKPFILPVVVQRKLEVGEANDKYEKEADRMADRVVQMNPVKNLQLKQNNSSIQRKCASCEEEEERIRKKPLVDQITPVIQRKAYGNSGQAVASEGLTSQINQSKGSGKAMDPVTKNSMERSFGTDFTGVRLHTDHNAANLSQQLNAKAFTVGSDIFFNQDAYQPNTYSGRHLLAHELTHTIQQGGIGSIPSIRKRTNQRIQRGILSTLGGAAEWAWDHSGGAAIRAGDRVIEWTLDKAEEIIESIAPGLLNFLRGGWESLRGMLGNALDAMTGGLFSQLQEEGLSGVLGEFVDSIIESLNGKIESACRNFKILAEKIFNFIEKLTGGALTRIRRIFNDVKDKLSFFWNEIGKPVVDAVKSTASDVWDWIVEKANWLWDLIEPIRNGIARAWNWLMDKFNIAWETGNSILDWLVEKLSEAWDWVMELIEPIKTPLMIIGGIILLLSPLGPFVLVGAAAYGVYRAVTWIKDNWDSEVFVRFKEYIKANILDPLAEGINELQQLVQGAFQWLNDSFDSLKEQFQNLMTAIGRFTLFRQIKRAFERFGRFIANAAAAIQEKIGEILTFLGEVISSIWETIRPFVVFVGKLIIVAINPWMIPIIIGAWYWRLLPDCYKPPIINFVLRMMILVLGAMPDFKNFGKTWFHVKTQILNFLQKTYSKSDEDKIVNVNRVAIMISELDLEFLSNMVEAVLGMPAEFEGQMEEELLGVDLTNPLPFERTEESTLQDRFASLDLGDAIAAQDSRLFHIDSYTDDDVAVDEIADFVPNPELLDDILTRVSNEGDSYEFGESPNSEGRDINSILNEIVKSAGGLNGTQLEGNGSGNDSGTPDFEQMSLAEEIEYRLQEMIAQSDENMATAACTPPEQIPQKDGADTYPEYAKFGPLSREQRSRYSMGQMWSGLGKWWRCNRSWLIPTLLGILAVLIVAELLTGGWVTAAIPVILEALIPLMIGVAAVRCAYYLGEYGYKAVAGDVIGAAKSLARSIAVVAVEVIFTLLGSSAFWRSVKSGASATARVAQRAGGALTRMVPGLGRVTGVATRGMRLAGRTVLSTGRAAISRGRLIMRGAGRRVGQSARTLGELAEGLFRRVRFRRFRIRLVNGWFKIEGYINPWVLLATGRVVEIDDATLQAAKGSNRSVIGRNVVVNGERGVIIGSQKEASRLTQHLHGNVVRGGRSLDENRELFEVIMEGRLVSATSINSRAAEIIISNSNTAARLIDRGLPHERLVKIIQNTLIHPGSDVGSVLNRLQRIQRFSIGTFDRIVSELAHSARNKYIGAEFILRFIGNQSNEFIAGIRGFEIVQNSRRIDVVINGIEYEFKNWGDLRNVPGLVNQMAKDYVPGIGLRNSRYVISTRAGITEDLLKAISERIRTKFSNTRIAEDAIKQLSEVIIRY